MATIKRGRSTGNMLRAQEQGMAAQQRASESYTQQVARGQQQGMQMGQMLGGLYEQGEARQEQTRANQAREGLTERGQDIQAASQGLQENPRYQQLQEEMQRGAEQAGKPLEDVGPRFVPTPEEAQRRASSQVLAEEKVKTERIRAEAYAKQVDQIRQARASGTTSAEDMKALKANLIAPMESQRDLLNRTMSFQQKPGDWERISQTAANAPDPQLQQDIAAKQMTPRVREFLERGMAVDAMTFIATTGDLPDSEVVDFSSPAMQVFTEQVRAAQQAMVMMGPGFQQFANIQSFQEKVRFINQVAALQTFQVLMGGGQQQGGLGGVEEGFMGAQPGKPQPQGPIPKPPAAISPQQRQQQQAEAQQRQVNQPSGGKSMIDYYDMGIQ